MGGHDAGEIASANIIEQLQEIGVPTSARDLRACFEERVSAANRRIRHISAERNQAVIGSTLAALLTFDRQYACLWAGDSRVYMLRGNDFMLLSRDHTEVQDLLDRGLITADEAATWPRRNVITRAIGTVDEPELDFTYGQIEAGDKFLICSDGLTAHVEDHEIGAALLDHDAKGACDSLVALTLDRGAVDNVTVVAIEFRDADPESTKEPFGFEPTTRHA